ncbi:DegT/DnrJ/EryC1/StrS aminotransferase family protein [Thermosulfurimonas marina]|uniref:DegT/DnrJ/EryC1/StrS aminotransferase family protein n=1 Tax=Thermosulfurimonas marina TaxID=2047767 RepID=A0A6H1WQX3_9BACT|nr:DegT/DnrJ/EryC1/StrS aminotransferase family protein [Thermosulfurimonas marina]QJA05559.1 DegT/DnrJ/EryC1/StrS aminotransferase family protein [Thermosulfurimonas marina]
MRFIDLARGYARYGKEIEEAVLRVLRSTQYILGPEVAALEEELARWVGVRYAIGVSSGTDALYLILKALDLPAGSRVLLPSFTFVATAEVVRRAGLVPHFVDLDPETFNLSVEAVAEALEKLGSEVSAVVAVSLFGLPADFLRLEPLCEKHGVVLIEDACQSLGAELFGRRSGSFGRAAATSFFPAKPLGGAGDGGMVFTNDAELAERIRALRVHGQTRTYFYEYSGINGRLDEIQAAILRVKLRYFEEELRLREGVARRYFRELSGIPEVRLPVVPEGVRSSWAQFTLRVKDRDRVRKFLSEKGIPTAVYYPLPLHLQPVFRDLGFSEGSLPETERAAREVLSLPMHPYLQAEEQALIAHLLREFYR